VTAVVRRCQWTAMWGTECPSQASFRVKRGREYDAQDSCRRHLALTVTALIGAEWGRPVTVSRIRISAGGAA
jgi:hypothetical protein